MPGFNWGQEYGYDEDTDDAAQAPVVPVEEALAPETPAPETPAPEEQQFSGAPGSFAWGSEYGYSEEQPDVQAPEGEEEQEREQWYPERAARFAVSRIANLIGGTMIAAGRTAESMQDPERMLMPSVFSDDFDEARSMSREEFVETIKAREGETQTLSADLATFLQEFGSAVKDQEMGLQQVNTWEDFKEAEGLVGSTVALVQYGIEQAPAMIPDMIGILYAAPAYFVARSGEIAQNRAETDRRDEVTEEDLAVGSATALVVSALEKFGAERVLGAIKALGATALRRITTAGGAETITEGLQETAEYVGERMGQVEMSLAEGFDRALAGAAAGGVAGAGIRGGMEAVAAVTGVDLGYKGDKETPDPTPESAAMDAVIAAQEEAEARVAAGGGDLLDQTLAGSEAASAEGEAQAAALEEQARVEEEREAAFEAAEAEAAAQKTAEVQEAEYQAEVQKGEGVVAIEEATEAGHIEAEPTGPTLGEVSPELQQLKEKMATPEPKPAPEQPKQIEDQRPIIVAPDGTATTAKELDLQIREQLKAQDVDTDVNTTEEGQVEPIKVSVSGLDVSIENPKGSQRNGRTLKDHYGEIPDVEGADGDPVDVFLGSEAPTSQEVFIIDQMNEDGTFDEHKVMVGYPNEMAARRAYRRNYDQGWKMGPVTQMTMEELKTWLAEGGTKAGPVGQEQVGEVISGEEELVAMQAREQFKGRRKPKLRYKLGEAQVEIIEDAHPEDPDILPERGSVRAIHIRVSEGGTETGILTLAERGDTLQVFNAYLNPELRGKQYGQQMILEAVRYAESVGKEIVSDTSVSVDQLRTYEALRKKGLLVVEYENAAEVAAALADKNGGYSVVDTKPIIKRMFTPAATEDIKYRDSLRYRDIFEGEQGPTEDLSGERVAAAMEHLTDEIPGVEILGSPDEAPAHILEQMTIDQRLGAKGVYDVASGKIYVFRDNHRTMAGVARTILHEGVAHKGLRLLLGDRLPALLEDIWQNGNQNMIRKIAEAYDLDLEDTIERAIAVEEYIAHLAETTPRAPILQQLRDALRKFLREMGLLETWNEQDIDALLRDSRRNLRGKPLNRIEFTEKVQIEETGEVVEITETADRKARELDRRRNIAEKLRECVAA